MSKLFSILILLSTSLFCYSQNLVPNGDFEKYGIVPCDWSASRTDFNASTVGWNSPTEATPDIFSTLIPQNCSNHQPNSTYASCLNGHQAPNSGNIFAGFYTLVNGQDWHEYIQIHLSSPMLPYRIYNVELYVSLADYSEFATNNIGVWFSKDSSYFSQYGALNTLIPQVLFSNVITDTVNWVLLKQQLIPNTPYEYLIIGNFMDDANTTKVTINPGVCLDRSYYYCDDVSVSLDTTLSVEEFQNNNLVTVFPNPTIDFLNVSVNENHPVEIILYDCTSRKLIEQKIISSASIDIQKFVKGIYFYEVKDKDLFIKKGRIIKI